MLREIRDRFRFVLEYRRALALSTPLIEGRETRRVAKALGYDTGALVKLPESIEFEPRATFYKRAMEWARG